MKKKISQTVLEYAKKNPLQLNRRWLDYLKRKKYKVIVQGKDKEISDHYYYSLIFPDNSTIGITDQTYINDNDYMITIIRSVSIPEDNVDFVNFKEYTEKDLDDVY